MNGICKHWPVGRRCCTAIVTLDLDVMGLKHPVAQQRRPTRLVLQETTSLCHDAFTLIELLIIIAVIGILASLLLPALGKARLQAQSIKCVSNLHQLGIAAQLYWDDNKGTAFRYYDTSKTQPYDPTRGNYYWFGYVELDSVNKPGNKFFDPTVGTIYSYLKSHDAGLCPSFNYNSPNYLALAATGATFDYGYNLYLGPTTTKTPPVTVNSLLKPANTALFADSAQINRFQANRPMIQEFYYIDNTASPANGHFLHNIRANVVFCDQHVDKEKMLPGSLDPYLPVENVGRLRPEILYLTNFP